MKKKILRSRPPVFISLADLLLSHSHGSIKRVVSGHSRSQAPVLPVSASSYPPVKCHLTLNCWQSHILVVVVEIHLILTDIALGDISTNIYIQKLTNGMLNTVDERGQDSTHRDNKKELSPIGHTAS